MLKKMRWRFIGAAQAAFTAVVVILLVVVNLWNYGSVTNQQDSTLEKLLEADQKGDIKAGEKDVPPLDNMELFSPEVPYMIRFYSVHLRLNGTVKSINQNYIASISEEEAQEYAYQILKKNRVRGYEGGYRYLVSHEENEIIVLFLNSERELHTMRTLLLISAAISAVSLAVVFALIVLLSGRVIAPYQKNMEAQKQFITNASHELKTPLTAISTSADVLNMEYENNEWVLNIRSQVVKLSKLITNLVTLTRLNEENPFPIRAEFSLSEVLWELGESFAALAGAKKRQYLQDIEDGLVLTGDRGAIQQMISILLDNALKYTKEGGKIILMARKNGKYAEISVSNTVDKDLEIDVSRLFERFYRGDESHSHEIGGTGIGLSIARATVKAHGGEISARVSEGMIAFLIQL